MRLINTTTLELVKFFDKNIPRFTILTHTLGEEKVIFEEMQAGVDRSEGMLQKD